MHGRRRFFSPFLFAAVPDGEPAGGGGAPAGGAAPPPKVEPAAPGVDLKHPDYIRHLTDYSTEIAKRTEAATRQKVLEEIKAEQERATKSAEENLKTDLANERRAATNAKKEADEARAEATFVRSLLRAGIQPQDELAETMAWQAAKVLAGDKPVDATVLQQLAADKPWLFKSPAPTGQPGTTEPAKNNPAAVTVAGTLSTQPGPSAAGAGAAGAAPTNARDMSQEQWEAWQRSKGLSPIRNG